MQASDIIQDEQELRSAQGLVERLLAGRGEDGGLAEVVGVAEAATMITALMVKLRDRNDRLQDCEQALQVMQGIVQELTEPAVDRSPGEVRNLARTLEVVLHSALQNGEPSGDRPRKRAR